MRTLTSLALLTAFAAFMSTPAAAQRDISPRVDQLNSKEELRTARDREAQLKKKKKEEGQKSGSGGGGAPSGTGSY